MGWRLYGHIDDVAIWNTALPLSTIQSYYTNGVPASPNAKNPVPANGSYAASATTLSWFHGENSTSHDVYLGTSFTDVNNATHSSYTFKGNQAGTVYTPSPALAGGTTYYWRIDEIASGTTTTGAVWSFTTYTNTAFSPTPAVGAISISTFPLLKWSPGVGLLHRIYILVQARQV